jgi:surface carbohydrate biosynthesis protein (TIGR04326 family)
VVYIALQAHLDLGTLPQELKNHDIHEWVYWGEDNTWRVQAETTAFRNLSRVPVADDIDQMAWKLRQPYINWIGELSQANNSLAWWASELAAKNPYTHLFLRICLLGVARQMIARGVSSPILMVCSTHALVDELLTYAQSIGTEIQQFGGKNTSAFKPLKSIGRDIFLAGYRHLPRWAGKLLIALLPSQISSKIQRSTDQDTHFRRQILNHKGIRPNREYTGENTILMFSWVDHRSFSSDGRFQDPNFGPLIQMLRDRGHQMAFVPQIKPGIPYDETVDKLLATNETFYFPESFVSTSDQRACVQKARQYAPQIATECHLDDIPVYRLTQEHIKENINTLSQSLQFEPLIANMKACGIHPNRLIHAYEGHSWEHALTWSVRKHMPQTTVVASEMGVFARMVHSEYPALNEFSIRPLPDYLVTYGSLYRDVLVSQGWPDAMVRVGGALKHNYLWENTNETQPKDLDLVQILVAPGPGFGETFEIVEKAARAFSGKSGYQISIKCHPNVDPKTVQDKLGQLAQQDNVHFVNTPISELLKTAQVLLFTYTSVCYEALKYGVFPIFMRSETSLNLNKMDFLPEAHQQATTVEDLQKVVTKVMNRSPEEKKRWQEKMDKILYKAFKPVGLECVDVYVLP